MTPAHRVDGGEIFLPVPNLGEEYTHLDCPECDVGEIPLRKAETFQCNSCGAEFELRLHSADN